MSIIPIIPSSIYVFLSWVVGPKKVEVLEVLGFALLLYIFCDIRNVTLQRSLFSITRWRSWKQIRVSIKYSCRNGSRISDEVSSLLFSLILLCLSMQNLFRFYLGCNADVSEIQLPLVLVLLWWIYFAI